MIEVCFCEKAHFYFTPPPHHPRLARKVCHFFWGGKFGDGEGNWYICGRISLLINVIFLDDEKDFDWAAFGGGLCEFGLG